MDGTVKPTYLTSKHQLADLFTKILSTDQYNYLLNKLGVQKSSSQLEGEY